MQERQKKAGKSNENSALLGNSQDSVQAPESEDISPRLPGDTDGRCVYNSHRWPYHQHNQGATLLLVHCRFQKVRQHLRPLASSAIRLMLILEDAEPWSASFAPHSFLLHELLRAVHEELTSTTSCLPSARASSDLIGELCAQGDPPCSCLLQP